MDSKNSQPATVGEYISQFPEHVQQILVRIRAVIKESAPEAEEKISYGMAGYTLNGGLIWFGGYKKHIGIYPRTAGMVALKEVTTYKGTKGSVHFPLDEPIPYDLLRKIVEIRVAENTKK